MDFLKDLDSLSNTKIEDLEKFKNVNTKDALVGMVGTVKDT